MKLTTILLAAAAMIITSCSSAKTEKGNIVTKTVKTGEFSNIKITGSHDVHFVQGNTTSVKVKGHEGDLKNLDIRTENGNLLISSKNNSGFSFFRINESGDTEVFVTSPNLRGLTITGSGDFKAEGNVDTDIMAIKITGSGDAELDSLICNESKINITGSGDVDIHKLTSASAEWGITGSGSIDIENANVGKARSTVSGSGSIDVKGIVKHRENFASGSGSISIE